MSHFAVLAILPKGVKDDRNSVEVAISELLAPFDENDGGSKWDWYVIGGRWSGALDGYDPDLDKRNYAVCRLCHGTGTRTDMSTPYLLDDERQKSYPFPVKPDAKGCNGCLGTGMERNFMNPDREAGDWVPVKDLPEGFEPFAVVTPDDGWVERGTMGWWAVVTDEKPEAEWRKAYTEIVAKYGGSDSRIAVLVDCHI